MSNKYVGQFVLSKREICAPPQFCTFSLSSWLLYTHESLPIIGLYTRDDIQVGWVIGYLIDVGREKLVTEKLVVPVDVKASSGRVDTSIEEFLYSFGGRYACIVLHEDIQRVYMDAAGTMSCVYSVCEPILSSSPGLILSEEEYFADIDEELYKDIGMPSKGWYPSGLTAHRSIRRLLPNHYLDMVKWWAVRHWPRTAIIGCSCDPISSAREIGSVIRSSVKTILKHYPVYITLTAGRDSRTLLACTKDLIDNIEFVTFVEDSQTVDGYVAAKLAERFKLRWTPLPILHSTEAQKAYWLREVGHCLGGGILNIHQTLGALEANHAILPALGGEVHKAHYYREGDRLEDLTSLVLLKRLKLPPHPKFLNATNEWLQGVSTLTDVTQVLGLAYIEVRLACWGMPQTYGQVAFATHIFPTVHRSIFTQMMSLPIDYRKGKRLTLDMIKVFWPELLDLPFNRYTGVRNLIDQIKRIRRIPAKIAAIGHQ